MPVLSNNVHLSIVNHLLLQIPWNYSLFGQFSGAYYMHYFGRLISIGVKHDFRCLADREAERGPQRETRPQARMQRHLTMCVFDNQVNETGLINRQAVTSMSLSRMEMNDDMRQGFHEQWRQQ
jgi:hypothetical protein